MAEQKVNTEGSDYNRSYERNNNNETNEAETLGISDFFNETTIMVTGGTGFLGKALLEKLLRSCPGIDTIYVLMRPKRGLSVEQRYKELIKNQIFEKIRMNWPERLHKLQVISGDVSAPNLGVSVEQRELLTKVSVVFHSAATVRFTEPLHTATLLNVQGTACLLRLAENMPLLKAFVHVSTAFSNAPKRYIEEKVYPAPYDPDTILSFAKTLPLETVNIISEAIQGDHPNTYTLTKALAETIVYSHTNLPVCIVRPSVVTAALQEPFPGWIDNVYGVTGLLMEILRGTYRSSYCMGRYNFDCVPVDYVVNFCILAAWRQGVKKVNHCPVYNVTSSTINPLKLGEFTDLCVKYARENPTKYVMWYPNFTCTESRFINAFWEITLHFLPAFLYDIILRVQGRKAIMMKLAQRFKLAAVTGEYFVTHEWDFEIKQLTSLHKDGLTAPDVNTFPHWLANANWEAYACTYMMGIRRFILKDTPDTLTQARTKMTRLYWLHKLLQLTTGYYIFRIIAGRLR